MKLLFSSKEVLIYRIVLLFLAGLYAVFLAWIFWELHTIPPCTSTSKNICLVNDWSIAGLAATVLGVAATVLAFLGAFAVAFFWKDLDKTVSDQVDARTKDHLQALEKNLEIIVTAQFDQKMKIFDNRIKERLKEVEDEQEAIRKSIKKLQGVCIDGIIFTHYPWLLTDWAIDWQEKYQQISHGMALRYVQIATDLKSNKVRVQQLEEVGYPKATVEGCLYSAQIWAEKLEDQAIRNSTLEAIQKIHSSMKV